MKPALGEQLFTLNYNHKYFLQLNNHISLVVDEQLCFFYGIFVQQICILLPCYGSVPHFAILIFLTGACSTSGGNLETAGSVQHFVHFFVVYSQENGEDSHLESCVFISQCHCSNQKSVSPANCHNDIHPRDLLPWRLDSFVGHICYGI